MIQKAHERWRCSVRSIILGIAAVMMTFGAYRGEMDTVLRKAVNICLECIGVG